METVDAFVARLATDMDLQQKANSATASLAGDVHASMDALASVAKDAGFAVTSEDLLAKYGTNVGEGGEISDEALEAVAGGAVTGFWFVYQKSVDSWICGGLSM